VLIRTRAKAALMESPAAPGRAACRCPLDGAVVKPVLVFSEA
jgi:hypothetical protein